MNIFTQASINSLSWNEDGFKLQNIRIAIQSTKHEEQIAHHILYDKTCQITILQNRMRFQLYYISGTSNEAEVFSNIQCKTQ
jgi:hypothetical protein